MKTKTTGTRTLNANDYFLGSEPKYEHNATSNRNIKLDLLNGLNWYSANKTWEDSKKYLIDYLNAINHPTLKKIAEIPEDKITNLGFITRMMSRGFQYDFSIIENKLNDIITKYSNTNLTTNKILIQKAPTVQDKVFEQATIYINDIEEYIDEIIKTKKIPKFSCYDYLKNNQVKPIYTSHIKNYYSPVLNEIQMVLNKENIQLNESYSHWTKKQVKDYHAFLTNILSDCDKYNSNTKIRKPRKQKTISKSHVPNVTKLISKLQYKKEDTELKIVSINPIHIIGSKQLIIYNTKTKILGIYISKEGLSIKGTTLINFDEKSSIGKRIKHLPIVGTQRVPNTNYKSFLSNQPTKEHSLTGRINSDTMLLTIK